MIDIASPELNPAAGSPITVDDGYRLYSVISAGPTTGWMVTNAPSGTMLPSLLRTYSDARSSGRRRKRESACTYTWNVRPNRLN